MEHHDDNNNHSDNIVEEINNSAAKDGWLNVNKEIEDFNLPLGVPFSFRPQNLSFCHCCHKDEDEGRRTQGWKPDPLD